LNLPKPKPGYKWEKTIFQQYEEIPKDWDFVSISEFGKIIGGGTPATKNLEYWENGDIPWFTPEELTGLESDFVKDSKRKITKKGLAKSSAKIIPENSILITTRANIGDCVINEKKTTTNQGFQNLTANKNHNNKFIMYSIRYNKRRLRQYSQGTTFLEISKTNFGKIKVPCPKDVKEEVKIGSILSNIHELIKKQQEVIEQTQKLKIGQTQKLFSEGINHNSFQTQILRFRWLKHKFPKEWKILTLESLTEKITDGEHNSPEFSDSGVPYLSSHNIKSKIILDETPFVGKKEYERLIRRCNPTYDDVLITVKGTIGICKRVDIKEKFTLDRNVALLKLNKKLINPIFLEQLLNFSITQKQIFALVDNAVIPSLYLQKIKEIQLPIPNKLEEQKKIASILSNLDLLIQQEKQYKEKLEKIKKGLMQQLLTGKTRVKV